MGVVDHLGQGATGSSRKKEKWWLSLTFNIAVKKLGKTKGFENRSCQKYQYQKTFQNLYFEYYFQF